MRWLLLALLAYCISLFDYVKLGEYMCISVVELYPYTEHYDNGGVNQT